jgi:hypothetical protein
MTFKRMIYSLMRLATGFIGPAQPGEPARPPRKARLKNTYWDIEDRGFSMDDVALQGSLFACMLADEHVAELWEDPPVDWQMLTSEQTTSRFIWEFEAMKASVLRASTATLWGLNIEHRKELLPS